MGDKYRLVKIEGTEKIIGIPSRQSKVRDFGIIKIEGERFLLTLPTKAILNQFLFELEEAQKAGTFLSDLRKNNIKFLRHQIFEAGDFRPYDRASMITLDNGVLQLDETSAIYEKTKIEYRMGTQMMLIPLKNNEDIFDDSIQKTTATGTVVHGGSVYMDGTPVSMQDLQQLESEDVTNASVCVQDSGIQIKDTIPWMVVNGCLVSMIPVRGLMKE